MSPTDALTVETIVELTQDIWASLLADDHGIEHVPTGETGDMTATVAIAGAWNGTAALHCSSRAGRHAASAMFDLADDELGDDEIRDAVGELINVMGGNIKGLLPGPTQLSLPTVHSEEGFTMPGHLALAYEVTFSWLDEPVVFSLWTEED